MRNALIEPLVAALDAGSGAVRLFVRDDDAGWGDAQLLRLLDCVAQAALPIDLAAIPQAMTRPLARELCARHDAAPDRLGVHQHGCVHANHESAEAKCEFGASRSEAQQRADIEQGRRVLIGHFEGRLDAIFTPPWNRCSPVTPAVLARLGYAALSRDRGAPVQDDLPEIAVDVDWCKVRKRSGQTPEAMVAALAAAIARADRLATPVGVMLHHEQMDETDLALLGRLLGEIALHPRACFFPMRALLHPRERARGRPAARVPA